MSRDFRGSLEVAVQAQKSSLSPSAVFQLQMLAVVGLGVCLNFQPQLASLLQFQRPLYVRFHHVDIVDCLLLCPLRLSYLQNLLSADFGRVVLHDPQLPPPL